VHSLQQALESFVPECDRVERLGRQLARSFRRGHRLLTLGVGGDAALAQQLANELVGRPGSEDAPLPALCLASDAVALSVASDEAAAAEVFSRQVRAQGRPGDVLVSFSSGLAGRGVLAATRVALRMGLRTVGFTGRLPNPLAALCCDVVAADAASPATVAELHHVALHVLAAAIEGELASGEWVTLAEAPPAPDGDWAAALIVGYGA